MRTLSAQLAHGIRSNTWPLWALVATGSMVGLGTAGFGRLLIFPGTTLAFALAAYLLLRAPSTGLSSSGRRMWAAAALSAAAAELLWLIQPMAQSPAVTLADVLALSAVLLAEGGLIRQSWGPGERFGRLRTILDVVVLAGVGVTLGWRALLAPLWVGLATAPGLTLWLVATATLALTLLVSLLVAGVLQAGRPRALGWAAPALLLLAIADLGLTVVDQRAPIAAADLALLRWGSAAFFVLEALHSTFAPLRGLVLPVTVRRTIVALVRRYAPLVAVLTLLGFVIIDWRASGQPDLASVTVACALALVFVARQGVAAGEHDLRGYAQLVEGAGDPAFICDLNGRIRLANPALMRALGLHDLQHVVGSSLFDWIQRAGRPLTLARPIGGFTPLVLEAGWSGEVRLQRRVERPGDEATSDFSLILRPIDADPPLLAGTAHDLAPQKRQQAELQSAVTRAATAQAELAALNRDLERRVVEKTRVLSEALDQLAAQNAQLQKLDELKSDFVSLVSHELRAPLTNLNGGLELVLARGQLAPTTRDHLALVQAEVRRLTGFVETILDLSALEAGRLRLNPAPLDLADVAARVRLAFAGQPAADRLRLALDPGLPAVLADDRALASVFFHLIDNAQKYAPTGAITLSAALHASGRVRVIVRDEGPGIPHEQRATAFERFQRLHNADDRVVYGHGLGLYMVRQLLRAQGSDIALAPDEAGAAFEFELPIAEVCDD